MGSVGKDLQNNGIAGQHRRDRGTLLELDSECEPSFAGGADGFAERADEPDQTIGVFGDHSHLLDAPRSAGCAI